MKPDYSPNVVDVDALEKIRLHEMAETDRVRIKETEETKRKDISERDTKGYMAPRIIGSICALLAVVVLSVPLTDYIAAAHPPPEAVRAQVPVVEAQCEDEFFKIDIDHTHAACTHSKQVSSIRKLNGQEVFYCQCQSAAPEHSVTASSSAAPVPAASASTGATKN